MIPAVLSVSPVYVDYRTALGEMVLNRAHFRMGGNLPNQVGLGIDIWRETNSTVLLTYFLRQFE